MKKLAFSLSAFFGKLIVFFIFQLIYFSHFYDDEFDFRQYQDANFISLFDFHFGALHWHIRITSYTATSASACRRSV